MIFFNRYSLRTTLPIIILIFYTLLLLINLIYKLQVVNSQVEQQGVQDVKREMSRLHGLLENSIRQGEMGGVESYILSTKLNEAVDNLSLTDEQGIVIYSTELAMKDRSYSSFYPSIEEKFRNLVISEHLAKTVLSDDKKSVLSTYSLGLPHVKGVLRSTEHQRLLLKYDLSNRKSMMRNQVIVNTTMGWFAGLLVYIALVCFLRLTITKPLDRIVKKSRQLAAGDLDSRVKEEGAEELVRLGQAFNEMASNISVSYKTVKNKSDLYNILSASNQAVLHSDSELALLDEACRIITDLGSFDFAWIGIINDSLTSLKPVASSGLDLSTVKQLRNAIASTNNWSRSVTAKSLVQNEAVIYNDIFAKDVDYPPELMTLAVKRNIRSIAAFPLVINGEIIGALTISNFEANYFSEEFIQLLTNVAQDISFGISSYRIEIKQKQSAALLAAQQIVLERIASGCSRSEIFSAVCQQIDMLLLPKKTNTAVCWVRENRLQFTTDSVELSGYRKTIDGLKVVDRKSPSMDAILQRKRIVVPDLVKSENWVDLAAIAELNKLSACFCTPILSSDNRALGSLDIYYEQPTEPTEYELTIVDRFVYLCGQAIERELALESIRQREENLAVTLDSIGDAVITVDIGGRVTRLNPVASSLTGWSSEAALGKPLYEVFHIINTHTRIVLKNPVEKVILTGKVMGLANHTSLISKDGTEYQIADSAAPILDNEGQLRGVILVFQDVSENYKIQEALQNSHDQLSAFNSVLPDLAFIFDEKGTYVEIYGSEEHLLKSERSMLLGRLIHDILPKEKADEILSVIHKTLLTQETQIFEYSLDLAQGEITFEARVAVMKGASTTIGEVAFVARNISERKKAEQEIEQLAFYDPLTKIPNRRLLMDRLAHEISIVKRHQHQLAILFLDLDHFKTLNDALGHSIGDSLLEQLAQRLSQQIRSEDTVARLGGDEFIILLSELNKDPDIAAKQARGIAEKIQRILTEPFFLFEHEHHISASIGISLFSADTDANADDVLKHADNAMYKAKALGRNQICFYRPDMQAAADARLRLESNLRDAIKNNNLIPFYQPQVNVQGQCVGLEVLLRWDDPVEGIISPAAFIPIAEESGLIIPVGEWVLRKSCEQLKKWYDAGVFGHKGEHFSVNISPKQFAQADFVEQVKNVVKDVGIDPKLLYLEITEGMVIDNIDDVIQKMDLLKAFNIRFSMDDFGTGYSSLSYLKRLPLQQLKIDRSFVRDIATDGNDRAIIEVILAVSDRLNLDVVAEGVENEKQIEFLTENGCGTFQGFHFGKPMPADAFENWLKIKGAKSS